MGNATTITNNAVTTDKILDANVTYAKIQDVSATNTVLGRVTAGAGVVEEISTTGSGNVVRATSPTLVTPDLGTPSSATLTNATGLPVSTGISGLGAGVATMLATPSSTNLAAAITDETGSGSAVFATSPTLTTPVLGVASATSINGTTIPATKTLVVTTDKLDVLAATTSAELAGVISDETGTGAVVLATNPNFVTPNIGTATGTSLTVSGGITSSGTSGLGYATGAGGAVTQLTSKSTAVTIDKVSGQITMNGASLGNNNSVTFQINNSTVSATDVPFVALSAGTTGNYLISILEVGSGYFKIVVKNISGGPISDVLVINFAIIKAVNI